MEDFARFEEKRKWPRFAMSVPIEYKMLRGSPEAKKGSVTKDISVGGTRFITSEFLAYTARMVVEIALPLPQRPVSAVSKISWIKKVSIGEKYEVGNQFLEMSRDDKNRLATYLGDLSASAGLK